MTDHSFCLRVSPFAEMAVTDDSIFVDEVFGWPVPIVISAPGYVVIVLSHRPDQGVFLGGLDHVFVFLLELKFRRMYPDDHQTVVRVFSVHFLQKGIGVDAVYAGIGPEIDQYHVPVKLLHGERAAVNPGIDTTKFGCEIADRTSDLSVLICDGGFGCYQGGRGD